MTRFIVHLRNIMPYAPKDATALLRRARELVEIEATIRDARVSKKYIEFDISVPDGMDINRIIERLEAISTLSSYEHIIERHIEKDEAIKKAMQLFNDEKDWPHVCISILQRARKKFGRASGTYYGIDVNRITDRISAIINSGKIDRF